MSQNTHAIVTLVKSDVPCLLLYTLKTRSRLKSETQ